MKKIIELLKKFDGTIDTSNIKTIEDVKRKLNGTIAIHSGDFTACKAYKDKNDTITAEYIDLDIDTLKSQGYKYLLIGNFIYDGAESYDEVNVYSGVQLLTELRTAKEQVINLNDSLFRFKLSGDFTSQIPLAIDVETNEILIIDQYSKEPSAINIHSMSSKMSSYKNLFFEASIYKENMYNFLKNKT